MKITKTIISLIAASVLFTACGGGGDSGDSKEEVIDDGKPKITSKPVITLNEITFDVISGHSKSIAIPLNEVIVNTDDGTSFYEYKILETTGGLASLDRGNFGFLKYTNDGTSETGTVKLEVSRDGFTSDLVTLTFNVVDKSSAQEIKVIMTGQASGDFGEPRVFTKDVVATQDNVEDALGLTWLDNSNMGATVDLATYTEAENICDSAGYRLPTEDDLYNIINYGKEYKSNLVDDTFTTTLLSSWAQKIDDKRIMVSNTTGLRNSIVDSAQFRCVKGTTQSSEHLILTDKVVGDTYDLSTHLQWAPVEKGASGQKTFADATAYCTAKDGVYGRKQSGWRVPTINELRSLIQDNSVTPIVHAGSYTLLSSTTAVEETAEYNYSLDLNWFKNEKPVITLTLQNQATINGTSYEPQTSGISCVRTFDDGDVPQ